MLPSWCLAHRRARRRASASIVGAEKAGFGRLDRIVAGKCTGEAGRQMQIRSTPTNRLVHVVTNQLEVGVADQRACWPLRPVK